MCLAHEAIADHPHSQCFGHKVLKLDIELGYLRLIVAFDFGMQVHLLKSKIHRATVTDASLNYEGSMTIAADLMEKSGLLHYERILVSNLANGNRFETYAIP